MIPKKTSGKDPEGWPEPKESQANPLLEGKTAAGANQSRSKAGLLPTGNADPFWRETPDREDLAWRAGPGGDSGHRSGPSLRAEAGAALERQLLLVGGPEEKEVFRRHGGSSRSIRRLAIATIFVTLATVAVLSFFQARARWEGKVTSLQDKMTQIARDSAVREEALRRESADKDRVLADRKAENQTLAALANKTLEELRTSLDDVRRARDEKQRLESDYRILLSRQHSLLHEILSGWLPRWLGQPGKTPEGTR